MDSICRFMPPKRSGWDLKTVHFVYEAEFLSLKQPFIRPTYYLHLVTSGEAVLKIATHTYKIDTGTVFFFFPGVPYEIEGDGDFRYAYVSFMGNSVAELLSEFGVTIENSVLKGFSHLTELWLSSLVRVNQKNANILTESVLLYTLSYISEKDKGIQKIKNSEQLFDVILDYVNTHYREADITLRSVANIFSYTEKYLSHFFKNKKGMGFNEYVGELRLQHAYRLMEGGCVTVSEIAAKCGFADPLYFSKFFKKKTGVSPSEYILKIKK